jgi:hypothetical protein
MRNLDGLTKTVTAVLLIGVWASEARADPANTTARALVAAWKDGDPAMVAVAEVIANGMSYAGKIESHPVDRPPTVSLAGNAPPFDREASR